MGYTDLGWSDRRQRGFVERVREAGLTVETFFCDDSSLSLATWERDQRRLAFKREFGVTPARFRKARGKLTTPP